MGGAATSAFLQRPRGLTLDGQHRNLYVADYGNHAVRVVSLTTRKISRIAGVYVGLGSALENGPATSAELKFPMGLDIDATAGHLFICDSGNHVIRAVNIGTNQIHTP